MLKTFALAALQAHMAMAETTETTDAVPEYCDWDKEWNAETRQCELSDYGRCDQDPDQEWNYRLNRCDPGCAYPMEYNRQTIVCELTDWGRC